MCLKYLLTTKTRYNIMESKSFLELQAFVKKQETEAKARAAKLDQKKEKFLNLTDIDKWELEVAIDKQEIKKMDKKQCFAIMLPKESTEVK